MRVIGQFRDLDRPDWFVWLRGVADMESRRQALTDFYDGPVWKAYGPVAVDTMVNSDDVLLLESTVLDLPSERSSGSAPELTITVYNDIPADSENAPVALLRTLHAANTFPRLPVVEGVDVTVRIDREAPPAGTVQQTIRALPTQRSLLR